MVVVVGDVDVVVVKVTDVEILRRVTSILEMLVSLVVVSSTVVINVEGELVNRRVRLFVVVVLVLTVTFEKFGSCELNVPVVVVDVVVVVVVLVRLELVKVEVSSKRTWLLDMTRFKISEVLMLVLVLVE